MKNILIYGIGNQCEIFLKYGDKTLFNIVGFVDTYKYGQIYQDTKVLSIDQINDLEYDVICITVSDYKDIFDMLVNKYGIDRKKIELPQDININYIEPQISNHKYILVMRNADYIEYMFKPLVNNGDFAIVSFLNTDEIWYDTNNIDDNEKVFFFGSYDFDRCLMERIDKYYSVKYTKTKKILMVYDLFDGENGYLNKCPSITIEKIKSVFNLIITYHKAEALKYGFVFRPYPYPIDESIREITKPNQYDLFFCGHSKDRLNLIHRIYKTANSNGIKCKFYITAVPEEKQLLTDEIIYNERLKYEEYIEILKRSRCILEICQKGDETSMRYQEAVVYNKKLLANDNGIIELPYYSPVNMQVFADAEDIDTDWIKSPGCDYDYKDDFDPINLLRFVDGHL